MTDAKDQQNESHLQINTFTSEMENHAFIFAFTGTSVFTYHESCVEIICLP